MKKRKRELAIKRIPKKFSGIRTHTSTWDIRPLNDGREYIIRDDDSKYPKLTTIPVSQSVQRVCNRITNIEKYHNYDELLLDFVNRWFLSKKPHLRKSTIAELEGAIIKVQTDCHLRKIARSKAAKIERYRPRKGHEQDLAPVFP